MTSLPDCHLCPEPSDPRMGLLTKDGDYYPLCDGCCPLTRAEAVEVASKCRALGPPWGNTTSIPRFGHNEPRMPATKARS